MTTPVPVTAVKLVRTAVCAAAAVMVGVSASVQAQQATPDLDGMWSDPPLTAADSLCFFYCTDSGIEYLYALLDDPANDERPYDELTGEVTSFVREQQILPKLTAAAMETYPLDPATDPGFLYCEPWGFSRQILAPHQLEIRQYDDRIEMRYGEWDARRTIHLDGRAQPGNRPPVRLGYSVGYYEGDALVIETSGISANRTPWQSEHSDQLKAVERYTRPDGADRLVLDVSFEDPWSLRAPLVLKKVWGWAPEQEIFPYEDCEPPTEFSTGTSEP